MIRRPPRSTLDRSSAASDVYKRQGRGCVDQIFTLKQVIEKMREKKNKLYLGFMDLQQEYDRVNREALWQVLVIYGVGGSLLNGIKSMYEDCLLYTSPSPRDS